MRLALLASALLLAGCVRVLPTSDGGTTAEPGPTIPGTMEQAEERAARACREYFNAEPTVDRDAHRITCGGPGENAEVQLQQARPSYLTAVTIRYRAAGFDRAKDGIRELVRRMQNDP